MSVVFFHIMRKEITRRPELEKFLQFSGGPFFLDRNKSFCE
ncbi:hypothetical protein B425_4140 [Bacillus amyloliquefaciens]|nr:hypothetical protein B425_4140 [Bacillus amyloliquefaciens]